MEKGFKLFLSISWVLEHHNIKHTLEVADVEGDVTCWAEQMWNRFEIR